MRIPKSKAMYVSAVTAIALIGGTAVIYAAAHKTITVQDNGERKVISGFTTGSLATFLKEQGIVVSAADHVTPSLTSSVADGMVVDIVSPKDIRLDDGGKTTRVTTYADTVGDFLKQQGIVLKEGDQLVQPLASMLDDGETLTIHRKQTQISTQTQAIPFQTIRQRTDSLFEGQQRVLTYGVKGLLEIKTTRVYMDGRKVSESVSKLVKQQPVTQVVEVGTRARPTNVSSRSESLGNIVGQLTVYATAYVAGGETSTGVPAEPGVVAVDPSVIPLGTKLYIPGVGIVRAEDTGGGVHGYHIDICLGSNAAANAWGAQTVTVYILG